MHTHCSIVIVRIDVLERRGGQLRREGALHAHGHRQPLLQGRVRLRALVLIFIVVTHLQTVTLLVPHLVGSKKGVLGALRDILAMSKCYEYLRISMFFVIKIVSLYAQCPSWHRNPFPSSCFR